MPDAPQPVVLGAGRDLTRHLTVFLITVGEPTTDNARSHIALQNCRFLFEEIANVCPMSAAFQRMIDRCTTPYYIEVDADMILKENAVGRLFNQLKTKQHSEPRTAMFVGPLFDRHLARRLYGVKIYDHEAFAEVPYRDVQGCETDQLRRLEEEGWTYVCGELEGELYGEHLTAVTPWQAFERYRDLMEKHRRLGHSPFVEEALPAFVRRLQDASRGFLGTNVNDPDVWSVFGLVVGCTTDLQTVNREKDARTYERDAVFQRLKRMMNQ